MRRYALLLALTACSSAGTAPHGSDGGGSAVPPGSGITTCDLPVPLADVSHPTTVVGTGTAASCTESAFAAAVMAGGTITFDCGSAPLSIALSHQYEISTNTVIDGGGLITLDGGNAHGILAIRQPYNVTTPSLTVQNITLSHGHTTDVVNTKGLDSGGAAIFRLGGQLTVINSSFLNNHGPSTGQDVAGGAIYSIGGGTTTVETSLLANNSASNGGAIGNLGNSFTLVNSRLFGNHASGTGGNPGDGGNGGGLYVDGQGTTITLCGDQLVADTGDAFGGGMFRVAYLGTEPTILDRTRVDSNAIVATSQSLAGGLYLQGTTITMTGTTIANNEAAGAGGFFVGPGATIDITNTTIASNTALTSLGGGLWLDASAKGTLLNVTIADNHAPGSVAFDGGIAFGSTGVTLTNSIVADNTVGNAYNPINCGAPLSDGGSDIEYPKSPGNSQCTPTVLLADPQLGPLTNNGGPTETMLPASGSPAIGLGRSCPATDQRGQPRAAHCTTGAVEAP
jgi:hypothetical protein